LFLMFTLGPSMVIITLWWILTSGAVTSAFILPKCLWERNRCYEQLSWKEPRQELAAFWCLHRQTLHSAKEILDLNVWIDTLRSHTRNLFHAISRKSLFGFLYWLKLPQAVKNAKRCKECSLLDLKQKCYDALLQPHGKGVQKTWFPHSTHDPLDWWSGEPTWNSFLSLWSSAICFSFSGRVGPGSYADIGVELRSILLEVDARLGLCSLAFYRLGQVIAVFDKVESTRGLQREYKITVGDRTRVDKLNCSWWYRQSCSWSGWCKTVALWDLLEWSSIVPCSPKTLDSRHL
jgi:hypothetical protein